MFLGGVGIGLWLGCGLGQASLVFECLRVQSPDPLGHLTSTCNEGINKSNRSSNKCLLQGKLYCKMYLLYSLETIRLDGKPSVVLDFLLIPDSSSSLQDFFLFNKL